MRLIDADALLKKATGYRRQTLRGRRYGAAVDVIDIVNAPTIRTCSRTQKHGYWEEAKCSKCGGMPWYSGSIYKYKYCPFCGAVMDGKAV